MIDMATRWGRTLGGFAGAIALAACGQAGKDAAKTPDAPPPSPTAAAAPAGPTPEDIAAAATVPKDRPNFRICLSNAPSAQDALPLTIPAGVIFDSWGRRNGDERNPALDADMLKPGAVRYAVVVAKPVTLTRAAPCAETVAQTALSFIFEWKLPLVRHSQDLQFQATGVENHMAFPLTNRLGDLVKKGLIFGYPTGNIGNPRALREDG